MDFNEQEKVNLNFQLEHFIIDACQDSNLKNLFMFGNNKKCLIMTLLGSTVTTERYFFTIQIMKNMLRNKMEAKFLASTILLGF